jgi:enediyne biosynthesis protein E4
LRHLAWIWVVILAISACSPQSTSGVDPGQNTERATSPGSGPARAADGDLTCWSAPVAGNPGPIRFVDNTAEAGLVLPLTGLYAHASAFGDVNGDDYPDLFVGTFTDRPVEEYQVRGAEGPNPDRLLISGPDLALDPDWFSEPGRTAGAVMVDLDGDSDDDVLVIQNGGLHGESAIPSMVYENVGGDSFEPHPLPLPTGFLGRTPAVADYDRDGDLDIYISEDRYGDSGGILLRNDGAFRFTDVTAGSGVEGDFALGATAADIDLNGLQDLVTSTAVYLGRGDLTFVDATPNDYLPEPVGTEDDPAGVAIGDVNRDGLPDIVIGQHYRATVEFGSEIPVALWLNEGGATFADVTAAAGIAPLPTLAPQVAIADLDNDSWPDIVASASAGDDTTIAVYHSVGGADPHFDVSPGLGSDHYWVGAPVVDLDRDGRLDVFALEWEPSLPSILFHNETQSGHWLEVSVDAAWRGLGTKITVSDPDGTLIGYQEIAMGGGFASSSLPYAHFGLGDHTLVEVSITGPAGEATLPDVQVDKHIRWPGGCGG